MKEASERSLARIKQIVQEEEGFRRFMRVQEAMRNFQMERRMIVRIAKEAGALYKVNTITLIDMDVFDRFFDEHYKIT
ncbi:MAG: hypothetical protein K6G67_06235 [Lachnospiraceae bacterium]|nr:hypothetical protein [Lachnospiraceae bacterium]